MSLATSKSFSGLRVGDKVSVSYEGTCRVISFSITALGKETEGNRLWIESAAGRFYEAPDTTVTLKERSFSA